MNQAEQLDLLLGKIVAARGLTPTSDGRLAYTTATAEYDIQATVPGSLMVHYFSAQKPEVRLWPADQELDSDRLVGTTCIGVKSGLDIVWHFYEPPVVAGCPIAAPISPVVGPVLPPDLPGRSITIGNVEPDGGTSSGPGAGGADAFGGSGEV